MYIEIFYGSNYNGIIVLFIKDFRMWCTYLNFCLSDSSVGTILTSIMKCYFVGLIRYVHVSRATHVMKADIHSEFDNQWTDSRFSSNKVPTYKGTSDIRNENWQFSRSNKRTSELRIANWILCVRSISNFYSIVLQWLT